jgi:hypothetical protein
MKRIGRILRGAAVPLFWYYALALLVPLRHPSALASSQFVEHALFVLFVPLALVGLTAVVASMRGVGFAVMERIAGRLLFRR